MFLKHRAPISGVATCGNLIATSGYDNQVILWDSRSKRALARSLHDHLANQCSFSHDGSMLVSASSDYSARIWEVPTMRLKAVLVGHGDDVDMAAFSPDDRFVATCALDRTLKIFDLEGRCLKTMAGHSGNVLSVGWTKDGKTLVSTSVDGTLRQWDVESGRQIHCTDEGVRTDTFVAGSTGRIFSGDDRGRIALIDGNEVGYVAAHQAGIKKLLYREFDGLLVSISYDRSIAFWRVGADGSLVEISRSILPALIWARAADFLHDSRIVLGTFGSRYATFDWESSNWDLDGIEPSRSLNAVAVAGNEVYSVGDAGVVFADGRKIAEVGSLCNFLLPAANTLLTGGQLGILFDAVSGETLYRHHSPLNCGVTFSRQGKLHAAIGSYTGEVLVFSLEPQLRLLTGRKIYENAVKGLVAGDRQIFSVCANTDVAWMDIDSLQVSRIVEKAHQRIANGCCRVGADSFASIGRDLQLLVYSGESIEAYQTPHRNSVKCIAASSDGKRIMTGSYGGTLAGFDSAAKKWLSFSRPTPSGISAIAYDQQNDRFLASSYDGNIYPVDESSC